MNNFDENILELFHHLHHLEDMRHEIHHCGGNHKDASYLIEHCGCGKHRIDCLEADGDTINFNLGKVKIKVYFMEECPEGGWHIEGGRITKND